MNACTVLDSSRSIECSESYAILPSIYGTRGLGNASRSWLQRKHTALQFGLRSLKPYKLLYPGEIISWSKDERRANQKSHYCTTSSIADHERLIRLELKIPPKNAVHSRSFWFTGCRKTINRGPCSIHMTEHTK